MVSFPTHVAYPRDASRASYFNAYTWDAFHARDINIKPSARARARAAVSLYLASEEIY